jgi:DNA-binding NarL/FixJ family response regulator
MADGAHQTVVLVGYEEDLQPGVSRCGRKFRWPTLDGSKEGVIRDILRARPRAVVIQLPRACERATSLIQRLAAYWNPIATIAVSGDGSERSEAAARRAGVTCFLPAGCGAERLEEALATCAPGCLGAEERGSESGSLLDRIVEV